MATIHIDSVAKRGAEKFVTATHPNGLQTNAYAVAKRLNNENVSTINAMIVSAGRSCFPNDAFSADLFEYSFLKCFNESQMDIYSALLSSSGADIGKVLKETAVSKDNLSVIQSDERFNIRIAPLHAEFQKAYRAETALKNKLRNALDIDVVPLADAKSWMAAVSWIVHNIKTNASVDDINKLLGFYVKTPLSSNAVRELKVLKGVLQDLMTNCDLKGISEDLAHSVGTSQSDMETAVITGRIDQVTTWQQLLNRMEAVSRDAVQMTDYRRAAEMASEKSFMLDFSEGVGSFEARPAESIAKDAHENTLSLARMDSVALDEDQSSFQGHHAEALIAHILMYAGIDLDMFDRSTKAGQGIDRPRGNVPLRLHSLANYYQMFLKDLWKCFVPEFKKLDFYTDLSVLATKNGMKPIAVDKAVPELVNTLRADIESLVLEIKNLGATGKGVSTGGIVDTFLEKLIRYEEEVITPFDDINVKVLTGAKDFIRRPEVFAETTRPIGTAAHPSANSIGFAEAILGVNTDAFGAVTESAMMTEISDLYNRVSDFSSVSAHDLSVKYNIRSSIEAALNDIARGTMRSDSTPASTILATQAIKGAHFAKLGEDFYAFVSDEEKTPLLLASGGASVSVSVNTLGNVHGSFSYGEMEPRNGQGLSGEFDNTVVELLTKATRMLVDGYVPRQVEILSKTHAQVSFKEENEVYAKRISTMDVEFTPIIPIDKGLLQAMASSPMINNTISEIVNKDLLLFVKSVEPRVRNDVAAYLRITASRQMSVLKYTYSLETLKMFHAMLTRSLTPSERMLMMRPEFASSAAAISKDLTTVMTGMSSSLRAVYTMLLFTELNQLPAFNNQPGEAMPLVGGK